MDKHVAKLIEKAATEKSPLNAMQYAQAALNAANARRVEADTECLK